MIIKLIVSKLAKSGESREATFWPENRENSRPNRETWHYCVKEPQNSDDAVYDVVTFIKIKRCVGPFGKNYTYRERHRLYMICSLYTCLQFMLHHKKTKKSQTTFNVSLR